MLPWIHQQRLFEGEIMDVFFEQCAIDRQKCDDAGEHRSSAGTGLKSFGELKLSSLPNGFLFGARL